MAGFPQRRRESDRLKDQKEELRGKGIRGFFNKLEIEGFMAQKGLWNLGREKVVQDRGALFKGEVDVIGEFSATHEETTRKKE